LILCCIPNIHQHSIEIFESFCILSIQPRTKFQRDTTMQTKNVVILALVFFAAFSLSEAKRVQKGVIRPKFDIPQKDNSWDFLLYVARWAGTNGYGDTLPSYVNSWTLHGIWPQRNDGSWPSFCNSSDPFDRNQIQDLYNDLEIAWYDFQGDGYSFWTHEWNKHGTCAMALNALNSQHKYFSFAIEIHTHLAIAQTLENAGFNPSNSNQYSMNSMMNALQQQFGQTPEVTCTNLSGLGSAIDGVTFCLDKSLNLMACPSSLKTRLHSSGNSCSSQVYFPPISH